MLQYCMTSNDDNCIFMLSETTTLKNLIKTYYYPLNLTKNISQFFLTNAITICRYPSSTYIYFHRNRNRILNTNYIQYAKFNSLMLPIIIKKIQNIYQHKNYLTSPLKNRILDRFGPPKYNTTFHISLPKYHLEGI